MKKVKRKLEVYEASDGKVFISKYDCEKHEKELKLKEHLVPYKVFYDRDLNETGSFRSSRIIIVLCEDRELNRAIVEEYMLDITGGNAFATGVQGCGYLTAYKITEIKDGIETLNTNSALLISDEEMPELDIGRITVSSLLDK